MSKVQAVSTSVQNNLEQRNNSRMNQSITKRIHAILNKAVVVSG